MGGNLKEDLAHTGLEVLETHVSWVFRGPTEVWKVKKPVSLGFLDFSTVAKRRAACQAELRLNRRLAPEVYTGLVPITLARDGRHRIGGDGEPVDWCVRMVRLPDDARADVRLANNALTSDDVDRIARRIAEFHARARADDDTARFGTADAIRRNVVENFAQTRQMVLEQLEPGQAREIETWQRTFLRGHDALLAERIRSRRIVEGHGDLRLEHVYLLDAGEIAILDCIEFNERFRHADVCADIAFLSMDLSWHGRVDLAERFLATYARTAGDYDLYPLVDFYESYRAYVRGKVASLLAHAADVPPQLASSASEHARRFYLLALASERRSLLSPVVVAVGGLLASGKSTVADRLSMRLGAPVVDSDGTRKSMLNIPATRPLRDEAWTGAYEPAVSERVYAEVIRRGGRVLDSGRPVILEATFRSRAARADARALATSHDVPFYFVECRADTDTCRRRLATRVEGAGPSDGRLEIFDAFVAAWEAVVELQSEEHIVADTMAPFDETMRYLEERLPTWPPGLTR